ncbi:unnamed protein product, partial [Mesorhabditis belari]|uniref:GATOR complex protein NPRL3 n=1 Tax=Mesorhabditis belari TaxID=2138241 RepID=A0AAF3J9A2_9BILA
MARVHYSSGSEKALKQRAATEEKIPLAMLFTCRGSTQQELLYLYPYNVECEFAEPLFTGRRCFIKKDQPKRLLPKITDTKESLRTPFGLSTELLASLLCVKENANDLPFELKLGKVIYVGFPKSVSPVPNPWPNPDGHSLDAFHVVFVLPEGAPYQMIERFQCLSRKLAHGIDALQQISNYLSIEHGIMHSELEKFRAIPENEHKLPPWEAIRTKSKLAALFAQVFDDLHRTGVVQVFMDNFVEIGFCMEERALKHARLTPRTAAEIDRLVSRIRPYHSVLLLEDVTPSPDANPNVALMIRHCDPDRSILDISTASGIPLMQVLLVVRHLLLWARAVVIYPIVNTNVYSSATTNKDLERETNRFSRFFGHVTSLGETLAAFNPPIQLDLYVDPSAPLSFQQVRTRIVVYLLRHQLLMQLHKFAYLMVPYSTKEKPTNKHCPKGIRDIIDQVPTFVHPSEKIGPGSTDDAVDLKIEGPLHEENENEREEYETLMARISDRKTLPPTAGISSEVKDYLKKLCGQMLEKEGYAEVEAKIRRFCQLAPLLNGSHHVEDLIAFSPVIATYLRPDFISCLDDSLA